MLTLLSQFDYFYFAVGLLNTLAANTTEKLVKL